jgi:hypothetical protein
VVTSLGDLEIADVRRVTEILAHTWVPGDGIRDEATCGELGHEVMELVEAEQEVDLGHVAAEILLVALHQAPHSYDGLDLAVSFQCSRAE